MATIRGTTLKTDGNNVSGVSTSADNDRDQRYRDIVQQQLGKNGIALFAIFGFVTILMILVVMFVCVGYSATSTYGNKVGISGTDILALTSVT